MGYRCVVRAWWMLVLTAGFASAVVATAVIASGEASAAPGTPAKDASAARAPLRDAGPVADRAVPTASPRSAPDPAPMAEKKQWVFDHRYDRGDIFLLGMHQIELTATQATPRAMGRFALELFSGPTLIERVRFDFPMLVTGGLDAGARDRNRVDFDGKLTSRIGVMFPATSRGNRLELWDRGTDQRWSLPWPPTDTRPDAGAR